MRTQFFEAVSQSAMQEVSEMLFVFDYPQCCLCFVPRVTNVLISEGGVFTGCGWPTEWELTGTGVRSRCVWLMAQRVSLIASVVTEETNGDTVQLLLNKSTELSWF